MTTTCSGRLSTSNKDYEDDDDRLPAHMDRIRGRGVRRASQMSLPGSRRLRLMIPPYTFSVTIFGGKKGTKRSQDSTAGC